MSIDISVSNYQNTQSLSKYILNVYLKGNKWYSITLCWTLVRLLGFEDSLGKDHEKIDGAHDKDTAPEADNSDDN